MRLIAEGHTDESIGHRLGITTDTAKKHLRNSSAKLGCKNRTELAVMFVTEKYEAKLEKLRREYGIFDLTSH